MYTLFVSETNYLSVSQADKNAEPYTFYSVSGGVFSCSPSVGTALESGPDPAKVVLAAFASFSVSFGTDDKTELNHMANP